MSRPLAINTRFEAKCLRHAGACIQKKTIDLMRRCVDVSYCCLLFAVSLVHTCGILLETTIFSSQILCKFAAWEINDGRDDEGNSGSFAFGDDNDPFPGSS